MNNDLENSINNLNKLTGKKSGFSLPKKYLEQIEEDIFIKLAEEQFSKKQSFTVPDNYFDDVETKILNKLNSDKPKVIPLHTRILKFVPASIAASFIIFFSIYFFNQNNTTTNAITLADIEDWFNDNTGYTDDLELAYAFENDIELSDANLFFDDNAIEDYFENVNTDDLINY